jgi:hypothetical protein
MEISMVRGKPVEDQYIDYCLPEAYCIALFRSLIEVKCGEIQEVLCLEEFQLEEDADWRLFSRRPSKSNGCF